MNKLLALVHHMRWPNLVMLVLGQWVVHHVFIVPFVDVGFELLLPIQISTVLVAAAGYLFNDAADKQIDSINKKEKSTKKLNKKLLNLLARMMVIAAVAVCWYLVQLTNTYSLFYVLIPAILVRAYATWFSKYKWASNILIALLIAFSLYFVYRIEGNAFGVRYLEDDWLMPVYFGLYCFYAFFLNWIREIVKDCEDIEGDKAAERLTIPILMGSLPTKGIINVLLSIAMYPVLHAAVFVPESRIWMLIPIILSVAFVILIAKANQPKHFKLPSLLLKIVMFIGVFLPLLLLL